MTETGLFVCLDVPGLHQIIVTYEGMMVPGSPFTFCVFDHQAVTVCPVEPVACNELVEFTGQFNINYLFYFKTQEAFILWPFL